MAKWFSFGSRPVERRSVSSGKSFIAEWMSATRTAGNTYSANVRNGYKSNPTAYGAIRLIADNAASIPLIVYEERGNETIELGPNHIAQRTLDRPNSTYSRTRFIQAIMTDFMVAGNAYVHDGNTPIKMFPHNLYRLRPDRVVPKLSAAKTAVEAYEYRPDLNSTKPIIISSEDVMHSWFIDPLDDVTGFAPLQVCAASIALGNDARTWNASLMKNKGAHSNIISIDADLSPEQEKALQESFQSKHGGPDNAGKSIVVRQGKVDVKSLNLTPSDVHWLEGIKLTQRDMSTALFVPSVLLNDTENNTYSNYQVAVRIFYTMTVLPLLDMICDDLTMFFRPRFGESIRIAYDADKIPALEPTREEKWAQVQAAEWLTINEKREHLGWGKLDEPDADKVWLPATMMPLGEKIPDFADNEDGRGDRSVIETRADASTSPDVRTWLNNERARVPFTAARSEE